jgi:hypothetical protein
MKAGNLLQGIVVAEVATVPPQGETFGEYA